MRRHGRWAAVAIAVAIVAAAPRAWAQRASCESVTFGERATRMAGATNALADEPADWVAVQRQLNTIFGRPP